MYLFNRKIEPSCAYCANGSEISCGEIACVKRGIVSAGGYCKRFKYEPTKREPCTAQHLPPDDFTHTFTREDFEL